MSLTLLFATLNKPGSPSLKVAQSPGHDGSHHCPSPVPPHPTNWEAKAGHALLGAKWRDLSRQIFLSTWFCLGQYVLSIRTVAQRLMTVTTNYPAQIRGEKKKVCLNHLQHWLIENYNNFPKKISTIFRKQNQTKSYHLKVFVDVFWRFVAYTNKMIT